MNEEQEYLKSSRMKKKITKQQKAVKASESKAVRLRHYELNEKEADQEIKEATLGD